MGMGLYNFIVLFKVINMKYEDVNEFDVLIDNRGTRLLVVKKEPIEQDDGTVINSTLVQILEQCTSLLYSIQPHGSVEYISGGERSMYIYQNKEDTEKVSGSPLSEFKSFLFLDDFSFLGKSAQFFEVFLEMCEKGMRLKPDNEGIEFWKYICNRFNCVVPDFKEVFDDNWDDTYKATIMARILKNLLEKKEGNK